MAGDPRLILLQARSPEDAELEGERRLFAQRLELPHERVVGHNLIDSVPTAGELDRYDAILIGGSGDYYVSNGSFPRLDRVLDLLREVAEGSTPVFGSCFGFHLVTVALGGEIVHDPESMQLGTYDVELTEAGRRDELFGELPRGFLAQLGRKDRASRLPEGVENLATSELCPLMAYRYAERPIWLTQFHPELDAKANRHRYLVYIEGYSGYLDEAEKTEVLSRFRESPATHGLLRRFRELTLG